MFGSLRPHKCTLDPQKRRQYQEFYCGLCQSLGNQYGTFSRALLNYDAVFLSLMVEALLPDESPREKAVCPMAPFRSEPIVSPRGISMRYASSMQMLLSHEWLADRALEGKSFGRIGKRLMIRYVDVARKKLSRLNFPSHSLKEFARKQSDVEIHGMTSPEKAASPTAAALGFVFRKMAFLPGMDVSLRHAPMQGRLTRLGEAVGRFIYFSDAMEDIQKDLKNGDFNPCLEFSPEGVLAISANRMRQCCEGLKREASVVQELFPLFPWRRHEDLILNVLCERMLLVSKNVCREMREGAGVCACAHKKEDPKKEETREKGGDPKNASQDNHGAPKKRGGQCFEWCFGGKYKLVKEWCFGGSFCASCWPWLFEKYQRKNSILDGLSEALNSILLAFNECIRGAEKGCNGCGEQCTSCCQNCGKESGKGCDGCCKLAGCDCIRKCEGDKSCEGCCQDCGKPCDGCKDCDPSKKCDGCCKDCDKPCDGCCKGCDKPCDGCCKGCDKPCDGCCKGCDGCKNCEGGCCKAGNEYPGQECTSFLPSDHGCIFSLPDCGPSGKESCPF